MIREINLTEFKTNFDQYTNRLKKGDVYIVLRRSKPMFQISSPQSNEQWETIIDFTKINKKGVSAKKVLKALETM